VIGWSPCEGQRRNFAQKTIKNENMRNKLKELYLFYINNFLTVELFADYLKIDEERAYRIIELGRRLSHYEWTQRQLKTLS
jgi:hypothetical protein